MPDALIQVAHGQMPEAQLERAMVEFYEGKYDILLATSIIESGLDIANANTIIVYDADRFGLAQLYQMRGRVGRSRAAKSPAAKISAKSLNSWARRWE